MTRHTHQHASKRKRLTWWQWAGLGLLVAGLLLAVSSWWVYRLWQSTPQHWQQTQAALAQDPQVKADQAQELERRLLAAMSAESEATDPAMPRQVVATYEQVNAWLAVKFESWLANQGLSLPFKKPPVVTEHNGRLVLSGLVDMPSGDARVVSLHLAMRLHPDGLATVQLQGVQINRLSIPPQRFLEQLGKRTDTGWLSGQTFEPVFPHPGNARETIRLTDFQITPQQVALTLSPQPRR